MEHPQYPPFPSQIETMVISTPTHPLDIIKLNKSMEPRHQSNKLVRKPTNVEILPPPLGKCVFFVVATTAGNSTKPEHGRSKFI